MVKGSLRIHPRPDGKQEVRSAEGDVLAVCDTNASAWRWIDRHTSEGQADTERQYRIQDIAALLMTIPSLPGHLHIVVTHLETAHRESSPHGWLWQ